MIELRAHCKINLGLKVVRRRPDGFHDIETVMMPLTGLYDTVSVAAIDSPETFAPATPLPYPASIAVFTFHSESVLEVSGDQLDCPTEQNICMRALRLMQSEFGIGQAVIKLHKKVPHGAGLGGGSADAAAVIRAVNQEFALELDNTQLEHLAAQLGSDVPFFVRNGAQFCSGRGEIMTPLDLSLAGLWIAVAKPLSNISTAQAYAAIVPNEKGPSPAEIVKIPISEWRENLRNDFETSVMASHPEIDRIKQAMYNNGATYASMSGSGSAVFGIFESKPKDLKRDINTHFYHIEQV